MKAHHPPSVLLLNMTAVKLGQFLLMTTTPNNNQSMPPVPPKTIVETGHLFSTSNYGRRNKMQHNILQSTSRFLMKLTIQMDLQIVF